MDKPRLFLLPASFPDAKLGSEMFHCPSCAQLEGLLSFFPELRKKVDVTYIPFPRPRLPIIELIGEENQSCPVIVLPDGPAPKLTYVQRAPTGKNFVAGADEITRYLATTLGVTWPHP